MTIMTPEELQTKIITGLQSAIDIIKATTTSPPVVPPPPTVPPPTADPDTTIITGTYEYEELHVHEGKTTVNKAPAELIRENVPISDPNHGDGGTVVHGTLIAERNESEPPIIYRSANPSGIRGHIMIHGTASIKNVDIIDMGRTRIEYLSPTNPIARYPLHFHLIEHANPSLVENCRIYNTIQGYRHGLVIHGPNKGLIARGNTIHHVSGSGIYLEDGNEQCIVENNTIYDIRGSTGDYTGTPERGDTRQATPGDGGYTGNGIYCRGPLSIVRNNVVRRCPIGYLLFFFWSPTRGIPLVEFSGNVAEDCHDGLQTWYVGGHSAQYDPEPTAPSVIRNFTARRCVRGFFPYDCRSLVVEDCTFEDCRDFGFDPGDYQQTNMVIRNCVFKNCVASPSTMNTAPDHTGIFEGCIFDGPKAGLLIQTPYFNNTALSVRPRKTIVRDCQFINGATIRYNNLLGGNRNYTVSDGLEVDGHKVYWSNQDETSILPQTIEEPQGFFQVVGCPVANLTNRQSLDQYGICRANAITPNNAVAVPWIVGGKLV